MNKAISCIVVDDHPAIRLALRMTLKAAGVNVVAESGDGQEALKLIRKLQPDIVLLDLDIPLMDGITLLKRLRQYKIESRVIVLSGVDSDFLAAKVRSEGGNGYMHKSESLDLLPMVLKLVCSGYSYFSDSVQELSQQNHAQDKTGSILLRLSVREFAIFRRLAKGESNSQIAEDLALSPKTVSTYKSRIFDKLNLCNIVELIQVAQHEGL